MDDAFFSVIITYVCIYKYHLLSLFKVTCVYMCLGLTPWDWITLIRELSPGEDGVSLSQQHFISRWSPMRFASSTLACQLVSHGAELS